jgi:hypothetical protein
MAASGSGGAAASELPVTRHAPEALGLDLPALQAFLVATGPVAVVDLETTGLPDRGSAEILEIGAVLLDPGRSEVQTLSSLVRPRQPVPRAVRALTGIRDADVADSPAIEAIAATVGAELLGRTIIAHNADFERYFLERFVSGASWTPRTSSPARIRMRRIFASRPSRPFCSAARSGIAPWRTRSTPPA